MEEEKRKNKIKFNVLAIICIIIFCFALSPVTLQNDTYYTIKIGELITQNGIDMQDHFSWHEDLPYTYPHWAYDTAIYFIYHLGNMLPIEDGGMVFIYISTIILASILGIVMYITNLKKSKNPLIAFIFTMFAMYLLQDFIAARAQLVTFILFALTILFIETFLKSKKKRYLVFLVIIAFIIANVHIAVWPFFFILFLPYIAEYIIASLIEANIVSKIILAYRRRNVKLYERKLLKVKEQSKKESIEQKLKQAKLNLEKQEEKEKKVIEKAKERRKNPYKLEINKNNATKWLIVAMIICALTGMLTPLGDSPYTYLVKTMQGNTTNSISEHQPLVLYNNKNVLITFALVIAILVFTKTKIKLRDLFMVGGLMYLSFMSRRQISMFVIIAGFIIADWVATLIDKYDKEGTNNFISFAATWMGKVFILLLLIITCIAIWKPNLNNKFIDDTKYPVEACNWILENLDIENVRFYNEYNYGSYMLYRGIPVFIDSRADLYAPEFNKTEEREGRDIFSDYINISNIGLYYENKFEEYAITHVILVNNAKLNMFLSRDKNYNEIYKDDYFVIYERNA